MHKLEEFVATSIKSKVQRKWVESLKKLIKRKVSGAYIIIIIIIILFITLFFIFIGYNLYIIIMVCYYHTSKWTDFHGY